MSEPTETKKPAKKSARITAGDIQRVASLVAKRLTEAEACRALNIPVKAWFRFKYRARNDARFQEELETMRGKQFAAHFANIESFEHGDKNDWRASAMLLKLKDPSRYSEKSEVNVGVHISNPIQQRNVNMLIEHLYAQPKELGAKPKPFALLAPENEGEASIFRTIELCPVPTKP